MLDLLLDSMMDTLEMLPYLIGTYLLIEWLAHKAGDSFREGLKRFGVFGSFGGAVLGLVPQCGFSVAAANFYADRIITPGTLIAVFLATSDEAIPVLLANPGSGVKILQLMGFKLILAIAVGLFVDLVLCRSWKKMKEAGFVGAGIAGYAETNNRHSVKRGALHVQSASRSGNRQLLAEEGCCGLDHEDCVSCPLGEKTPKCSQCEHYHFHKMSEEEKEKAVQHKHTHCGKNLIWEAVEKTLKVAVLIFIVSFFLNWGFETLGPERVSRLLMSGSIWQPIVSALIGLVPSCAASVVLTELYIEGSISFGAAIAGLCAGSGAGLLILFQANKDLRQNLLIVLGLFLVGSMAGILIG